MKYMTINNRKVAFDDEKNVLSVIRKAGINLPTFCYHSELSTYGACRMCVVEDDRGKIFASCSEVPRNGMVIYTNTPKLQHHRKMILELMLSAHCRECTTCKKNGDCTLQNLAKQLGVSYIRFENNKPQIPIDESSDCIVIDKNKCILCGDCVRTCEEIQGLGILDFAYRGSKMQVMPAFDRKMAETACVGCGQCRVVCPTGAITIKHNIHPVWEALADKNTRVVVQIAPAVRVAVGDKFGIPKGENSLGKLVAALRRMISKVQAYFEYNEKDGKYYRFQYGGPHIDESTGEQLSYDNVIFQYCYGEVRDANDYLAFGCHGDNNMKVQVFTQGKMTEGTWSRYADTDPAYYVDKNGDPIQLSQGKTWICLIWDEYADDVVIE